MKNLREFLFEIGVGPEPQTDLRTQAQETVSQPASPGAAATNELKKEVEELRKLVKDAQTNYITTLSTIATVLRNPDDEVRERAADDLEAWLAQANQTRH